MNKGLPLLMIWGTADPLNPIEGGRLPRSGSEVVRPAAEASWREWSRLLNCTGEPTERRPVPGVTHRAYSHCDAGSSAELMTIDGLGHQWPGGRIYLRMVSGPGSTIVNATDTIWAFFNEKRPSPSGK